MGEGGTGKRRGNGNQIQLLRHIKWFQLVSQEEEEGEEEKLFEIDFWATDLQRRRVP